MGLGETPEGTDASFNFPILCQSTQGGKAPTPAWGFAPAALALPFRPRPGGLNGAAPSLQQLRALRRSQLGRKHIGLPEGR